MVVSPTCIQLDLSHGKVGEASGLNEFTNVAALTNRCACRMHAVL